MFSSPKFLRNLMLGLIVIGLAFGILYYDQKTTKLSERERHLLAIEKERDKAKNQTNELQEFINNQYLSISGVMGILLTTIVEDTSQDDFISETGKLKMPSAQGWITGICILSANCRETVKSFLEIKQREAQLAMYYDKTKKAAGRRIRIRNTCSTPLVIAVEYQDILEKRPITNKVYIDEQSLTELQYKEDHFIRASNKDIKVYLVFSDSMKLLSSTPQGATIQNEVQEITYEMTEATDTHIYGQVSCNAA